MIYNTLFISSKEVVLLVVLLLILVGLTSYVLATYPVKEYLHKVLGTVINWLTYLKNRLYVEPELEQPYISLSPNANADEDGYYTSALTWALKSRVKNDIKNIALTGSYGSGKSSILKTFQKNYIGDDLKFLNISLATFKDGSKLPLKGEPEVNAIDSDLLRLIELSILQQIFYHEKADKLPDSRFKRIIAYRTGLRILHTVLILLFFIAAIYLIYPSKFLEIVRVTLNPTAQSLIHYTSLAVIIVGLFIWIKKSIRVLKGISISKFNIQNAEFTVPDSIDKSILNHHIDEILYFFEVTPYNVVIIEDLDRFEQTEIFTKLREINLLINNTKKIGKHVVFIYAVKDDMFKENDRTKFFDFIIPVIPVINSSNSSEKILELKNKHLYNISDDIIEDLSLFIDDMRLIYNIMNEFYIYHQKLSKSLSQNKLLAILVYKNIFPTDFSLLSNNEGILFKAINNKAGYKKTRVESIEAEIQQLKDKIKELESIKIKDEKELRSLYVLSYIPHLANFSSFIINNVPYKHRAVLGEELFEYFIKDEVNYYRVNQTYQYPIEKSFVSIENEVDSKLTYQERLDQINDWNNEKVEILKKEIQDLEKEKSQTKSLKIKDILSSEHVNFGVENDKQNTILNILLKKGYIDEDYIDFISIFYEGSITRTDHQFLLNVKSQVLTNFDYKLHKVDKLIEKLNIEEFSKEYILNYDLLDSVMTNLLHRDKKVMMLSLLSSETSTVTRFVDEYVERGMHIDLFINELSISWKQLWTYIESKSDYTLIKKNIYFQLIIEHSNISAIEGFASNQSFIATIYADKDFLNIIQNTSKLKDIIKALNLKFRELNFEDVSEELIGYMYDNNNYAINPNMVKSIIKHKGSFDQVTFDTRNFKSIKNSGCSKLISYIENNIEVYVNNIYLGIDSNTNEEEAYLLELLNNENLSIETKKNILIKVDTKVSALSDINSIEVETLLLEVSKVIPSWKNLYQHYENSDNTVSDPMIQFINNTSNADELFNEEFDKDNIDYKDFYESLITTDLFETDIYAGVLKSASYPFPDSTYDKLAKEKISLLIENRKILFEEEAFQHLKSLKSDLHIKLVENNISSFLSAADSLELESVDVIKVLKSGKLSIEEKNIFLDKIDEDLINSEQEVLNVIGVLIISGLTFKLERETIKLILTSSSLRDIERIRIFNLFHQQVGKIFYSEFLNSLSLPYKDIATSGKRPSLPNNNDNLTLAKVLLSNEYISSFDTKGSQIKINTFTRR